MKNFIKDNTGLIIRFDDVAENMNWQTFTIIEMSSRGDRKDCS